ncbi:MAG TPA: TIGR03118 family protein [Bryobacteraceae bacterium]|jgi:uncharacterized protein (TIGR03118 family)|nr:TIGR03118 family protein [Bryobacteraceae bacterium]
MFRKTLLCLFSIAVASAQTSANVYVQHNLVSSVPGMADLTDPNLIDPWGMSFSATSPFWVSNHGKGNTTIYSNPSSTALPTISTTVVTIPSGAAGPTPSVPTGQVQNGTGGFLLANGKAASFIFCTEDGTISAWNGGTAATVMVDYSTVGTVYKGMAIANNNGAPMLYAANFSFGKIDVFDTNFKLISAPGGFGDANLPAGYAPFNIWPVNGKMIVTFAKQNATKTEDEAGVGNGVVDIFDLNGNLQQRLTSGGPLNSPWGVAEVGGNWGAFGPAILVGNFGDGHINAFDPTSGKLLGTLQDATGAPIAIQGLWAIELGNGGSAGDPLYLYFTAGIINNGTQAGLMGSIAPQAQITGAHNAATGPAPAIAPGEVVQLTGITIGPRPAVSSPSLTSAVGATTTLGGTTVTVNGMPAPILYTQADVTNIIVPFGVTGTTASIVVTTTGVGLATPGGLTFPNPTTTQTFQIPLAPTSPGLFPGVAFNQDGTLNTAANPAAAGTVVILYATGLGQTDPPGQDGVRMGSLVLAETVAPVTATIGGQAATVAYAGSAPGQISGIQQVELIVPAGAGTGQVPVVITAGGVSPLPGAVQAVYLK